MPGYAPLMGYQRYLKSVDSCGKMFGLWENTLGEHPSAYFRNCSVAALE
jgi:hypothetical protein